MILMMKSMKIGKKQKKIMNICWKVMRNGNLITKMIIMKKMKSNIITLIFGERRKPIESFSPGVRTTHPPKKISFNNWCKELNVSGMYQKN